MEVVTSVPKTGEMEAAYAELRRIARFHMHGERADHTLQATELVHEAYLILAGRSHVDWSSRAEIVALAVTAMRHFLIDYARKRTARRRGGGQNVKVPLSDLFAYDFHDYCKLIEIDCVLDELANAAPHQARVVELRLFGGYSEVEIAELMQRDARTVQRYWKAAQEFFRARMGEK